MADISQIKLPDNTTYDINAKKVNSHTVATDVPSGAVFTDTKNTAGSTDTSSKIYLVGATEQSANPQTYSNDQVYVENGKTYAREFDVKNPNGTIVVALVSDSTNGGQFNLWNSDGVPQVWAIANSGNLHCRILNVIERVDNANKRRVRNEIDTTDHYGRTIWYEGNNVERVVIRANNDALNILNSSGAAKVNLGIDSYDHGTLSLYDENNSSNVYAYGSGEVYARTYLAMDSNENITAQMEGSNGKVTCQKMNIQDISSQFTIAKSSGNWALKEIQAYRMGSLIQMNVILKGNGSAVANGANGFVGTITAGPRPFILTRFIAMASGSAVIGYYNPDDNSLQMRNAGSSITLASTSNLTCGATFLTND